MTADVNLSIDYTHSFSFIEKKKIPDVVFWHLFSLVKLIIYNTIACLRTYPMKNFHVLFAIWVFIIPIYATTRFGQIL